MLGVVEGFYGRQWSWQARRASIDFLASQGFEAYIYAPKGEAFLRRRWSEAIPAELRVNLQELSAHCRRAGMVWGLGLSPLGASRGDLDQLLAKVDSLLELEPQLLWLLFDDMRGDLPDLAAIQCELANRCAARAPQLSVAMCPSYYSFDPVLEKLFGKRPDAYWEHLGAELAQSIDILWTGSRVCEKVHRPDDLRRIGELLRRRPLLWDNYPVNDGELACQFLRLKPFSGRPPEVFELCCGQFANPMNQPCLSWPALASLAALRGAGSNDQPQRAFERALDSLCSAGLAALLHRDAELFSEQGLGAITPRRRDALKRDYQQFSAESLAAETLAWLNDEYAFDPACLT